MGVDRRREMVAGLCPPGGGGRQQAEVERRGPQAQNGVWHEDDDVVGCVGEQDGVQAVGGIRIVEARGQQRGPSDSRAATAGPTAIPSRSARPGTTWATGAAPAPSCADRVSSSQPSARAPMTCAHGQNGGAPPPSQQRPQRTLIPRWRACADSCSASQVLPTPGSPAIRNRRPRSPTASSRAARSSATSRSRPTNTRPAASWAGSRTSTIASASLAQTTTPGNAPLRPAGGPVLPQRPTRPAQRCTRIERPKVKTRSESPQARRRRYQDAADRTRWCEQGRGGGRGPPTRRRPSSTPTPRNHRLSDKDEPMPRTTLYRLTYLAVAMSLGHHLDHVIRHNAVGWPLTDKVNAFTISLVVYPVIATGLLLYRAGRVGPGFWALVSGGGAVFVSAVHFGPSAIEPQIGRASC